MLQAWHNWPCNFFFFFTNEWVILVYSVTLTARQLRYSSIHEAAKNGDVEVLEAMVKEGASINEIDTTKDKFTPMHWACYRGALEVGHHIINYLFLFWEK